MEVYVFKEWKQLRDPMAHNDEQISCTDDWLAKAKTVTNEINYQILAWRGIWDLKNQIISEMIDSNSVLSSLPFV